MIRVILAGVIAAWPLLGVFSAEMPEAVLRLKHQEIDLGVLESGAEAVDSVAFYNDGSVPLVIKSVFSDCGCTVADYTKPPVAPGDSGVVSVKFVSKGRAPGSFRKAVRIRSNARNHTVVLFVGGRIKRAYRK